MPMFVSRFSCITFISWINFWLYLHVYWGKNVLPSQDPILGSRLKI